MVDSKTPFVKFLHDFATGTVLTESYFASGMLSSEDSIVESLVKELDLSRGEASLYLHALKDKVLKATGVAGERAALVSLHARGMIVVAANGRDYLPVHPRLALSNLFRAYEEKLVRQRKEKRLTVDKITLALIPIYEQSKVPSSVRGEGTGR